MDQEQTQSKDSKIQLAELKSGVNVLRNELKNIRLKLATLEKIHKKYVIRIEAKQREGANSETTGSTKLQTRCKLSDEYFTENLKECVKMIPIGYLESPFLFKNGTPRQPSVCQQTTAKLKLLNTTLSNPSHALQDLDQFSHIWLIFVFHQNDRSVSLKGKVAPPRLNGRKVGVFATRSPHRVNPIGLSLVKLDKIEGDILHLSGIDMIDGTPIIDIKPYIPSYDQPQEMAAESSGDKNVDVVVPDWIKTPAIQQLQVRFTPTAEGQLNALLCSDETLRTRYPDTESIKTILTSILRGDPRSVYRRNRCTNLLYHFKYDAFHLSCWVDDPESVVEILKVRPVER